MNNPYMNWHRERAGHSQFCNAVIVSEERTRMTVLINTPGGLKLVRPPVSEKAYMKGQDLGDTQIKKSNFSLRKLARKPGTSRQVKEAVRLVTSPEFAAMEVAS